MNWYIGFTSLVKRRTHKICLARIPAFGLVVRAMLSVRKIAGSKLECKILVWILNIRSCKKKKKLSHKNWQPRLVVGSQRIKQFLTIKSIIVNTWIISNKIKGGAKFSNCEGQIQIGDQLHKFFMQNMRVNIMILIIFNSKLYKKIIYKYVNFKK